MDSESLAGSWDSVSIATFSGDFKIHQSLRQPREPRKKVQRRKNEREKELTPESCYLKIYWRVKTRVHMRCEDCCGFNYALPPVFPSLLTIFIICIRVYIPTFSCLD